MDAHSTDQCNESQISQRSIDTNDPYFHPDIFSTCRKEKTDGTVVFHGQARGERGAPLMGRSQLLGRVGAAPSLAQCWHSGLQSYRATASQPGTARAATVTALRCSWLTEIGDQKSQIRVERVAITCTSGSNSFSFPCHSAFAVRIHNWYHVSPSPATILRS